jgi:hypothetical protein
MQRIVSLSTGDEVTFRPHFTHRAQTIWSAARERGVVDREYLEGAETKVVRERPITNYGDAIEETLLYMIEKVKHGEAETEPSREWLWGLPEPDYAALAEAMGQVRKDTQESIAAGKKNR